MKISKNKEEKEKRYEQQDKRKNLSGNGRGGMTPGKKKLARSYPEVDWGSIL